MADRLEGRLVGEALALALERRLPGEGLLAHADRGSQYASDHYQRRLARHGIPCRMSRRADCWDHAPPGELLCLSEEGAGPGRRLRHPGGGPCGDRGVHRGLRQQPAAALFTGVRFPGGVRTEKPLTPCPLFVGNSTGTLTAVTLPA